MGFQPYIQGSVQSPLIDTIYAGLKEHVDETHGLMSALGSFWFESFGNMTRSQNAYETIMHAMTGCVLPLSDAYRGLLDVALEASIYTVPEVRDKQLELVVFQEPDTSDDTSTAEHIYSPKEAWVFHKTPILDVDYFMANLYGSPIVLEKGTHYDVDDETGDITFYVDIFGDQAIIQDAYGEFDKVEHPQRSIMLWGVNVVQQSFRIWERYGQLVYRKAADSMDYKALIDALMYYFVNMKDVQNVENVMNIVAGIPYARHEGEIVKRVYEVGADLNVVSAVFEGDDYFVCIETEYNGITYRYYSYGLAKTTVKVGDVLSKYQLMGRLNEVYDYLQIERNPRKFIPATAHPEEMTKDEQIDYVYAHWNDTDNSSIIDEDVIELTPEIRSDIIRSILKYNSLFIKQIISMQSYDTYLAQVEEMRKVLRAGLPVYLNPLLETIFAMKLVDYIPTDAELQERIATAANEAERKQWSEWAQQYAVVMDGGILADAAISFVDQRSHDRVYDGEMAYNGGTCRDHNSEKTSFTLLYNGYTKYNADWAHHGSSTHGATISYNGSVEYGNCMLNLHDYESDLFKFTKFKLTTFADEFPYSDKTGAIKKQIYYDKEYLHDGLAKYGLTEYMPKELQFKSITETYDVFQNIADPFEISVKTASSTTLDIEDFASYDDNFAISLGIQDTVPNMDDMLVIRIIHHWNDELPEQEDMVVFPQDIAG